MNGTMKTLKPFYKRRLPHYQPLGAILFVTFRLVNTIPKEEIAALMQEREINRKPILHEHDDKKRSILIYDESKRYFGHFDSYLDQAKDNVSWLTIPSVAKIVYDAILFYDQKEYDVVAFCLMPNHVHLLADMRRKNIPLHSILQRVKSYSAVKANPILKRNGSFWHRENYDHIVRDAEELNRIIKYILNNPVKARLCQCWENWRWTYLNKDYL